MAKRLYSEVVSGSGSSEDEQYDGRPTGYPQLHWLSNIIYHILYHALKNT